MQVAGVADIGGTNTRIAIIADDGTILVHEKHATPGGDDPAVVTDLIISTLCRFLTDPNIPQITGIGISVAGPVDHAGGAILNPPNMSFDLVPVVAPLHQAFHCPVFMMNDCRAAVLGEVTYGGGIGYRHVVYITISTGIGGGVYTNGRVLLGRGGNAGEIGHVTVDTMYNHQCSCGHAGHWEGYASGGGIPRFYQTWCRFHSLHPGSLRTAEEILASASRGESPATDFLQTLALINSRGLSTVIVAYDPEILIFDGPVITMHQDLILAPALRSIDTYLTPPVWCISPLGGNAPLLGVAAAVFSGDAGRE